MNERKILIFITAVIVYCMYSVHMWFMKQDVDINVENVGVPENISQNPILPELDVYNQTEPIKRIIKPRIIPLYLKDACSILEVFTQKPPTKYKINKKNELSNNDNTITAIGITVFLIILLINGILEAIQAKEDERVRKKLNPDGERRQSLAEFANKKPLRRDSSRLGLQLFQIAESFMSSGEEEKKPTRHQARPYTRGDSTNSYLSEIHRKSQAGSAPASVGETSPGEPRLVKRQSVAKLFGARPAPMVRRSSFPALPQNPEVQALMLGHRQQSVDSDDEGDGKGRRVRIIQKYSRNPSLGGRPWGFPD